MSLYQINQNQCFLKNDLSLFSKFIIHFFKSVESLIFLFLLNRFQFLLSSQWFSVCRSSLQRHLRDSSFWLLSDVNWDVYLRPLLRRIRPRSLRCLYWQCLIGNHSCLTNFLLWGFFLWFINCSKHFYFHRLIFRSFIWFYLFDIQYRLRNTALKRMFFISWGWFQFLVFVQNFDERRWFLMFWNFWIVETLRLLNWSGSFKNLSRRFFNFLVF